MPMNRDNFSPLLKQNVKRNQIGSSSKGKSFGSEMASPVDAHARPRNRRTAHRFAPAAIDEILQICRKINANRQFRIAIACDTGDTVYR
jgi:hypothetical protein